MAIASTSKLAYAKIKSGLGARQIEVYEAIKELGTATNEQIADYLVWPINRVTGRVTELKRLDMVDVVGIGRSKSGFGAKIVSAKDINDKQLEKLAIECGD